MEIAVYNAEGKSTGNKVTLDEKVFGIEPNDHAIYLDVKRYLAAQRTGTHKSKERAEIAGSTRKIKKQKGTGTARAGSIKSPVFRGGGTIFGPRPRNYSFKVNKKVMRLARKSALAYKAKNEGIVILDKFEMSAPRTKDFAGIMKNLKLEGKKTLVVLSERNDNVYLASRNVAGHNVQVAEFINTYDIMNAANVVFVGNAYEVVANNLNK